MRKLLCRSMQSYLDFVPTELTPKQKQLQEQAEKYKKMRVSKVGTEVKGQRSKVVRRSSLAHVSHTWFSDTEGAIPCSPLYSAVVLVR